MFEKPKTMKANILAKFYNGKVFGEKLSGEKHLSGKINYYKKYKLYKIQANMRQ